MSERRRFRDSSLSLCAFCLSSSRWSVTSASWRLCCARTSWSWTVMAANSASKDEILWTEKIGEGEWDLSVFRTAQADFFSDVKQLFIDQKKEKNKQNCMRCLKYQFPWIPIHTLDTDSYSTVKTSACISVQYHLIINMTQILSWNCSCFRLLCSCIYFPVIARPHNTFWFTLLFQSERGCPPTLSRKARASQDKPTLRQSDRKCLKPF